MVSLLIFLDVVLYLLLCLAYIRGIFEFSYTSGKPKNNIFQIFNCIWGRCQKVNPIFWHHRIPILKLKKY